MWPKEWSRLCLYAMPWCGCTFLESNLQPHFPQCVAYFLRIHPSFSWDWQWAARSCIKQNSIWINISSATASAILSFSTHWKAGVLICFSLSYGLVSNDENGVMESQNSAVFSNLKTCSMHVSFNESPNVRWSAGLLSSCSYITRLNPIQTLTTSFPTPECKLQIIRIRFCIVQNLLLENCFQTRFNVYWKDCVQVWLNNCQELKDGRCFSLQIWGWGL